MEERTSEYWDSYYAGMITDDIDQYDDWLTKHANYFEGCQKALDLGCGAGTNIQAMLLNSESVYAADFSPPALELVERQFVGQPVFTVHMDMRGPLPFADDCFDVVVADLSLHYFGIRDCEKIFSEINRVTSCKGAFIGRVHSLKNLKEETIGQVMPEPGLFVVGGYQRKYFSITEISELLREWHIRVLQEKQIFRYGKNKFVIEFVATPKTGEDQKKFQHIPSIG